MKRAMCAWLCCAATAALAAGATTGPRASDGEALTAQGAWREAELARRCLGAAAGAECEALLRSACPPAGRAARRAAPALALCQHLRLRRRARAPAPPAAAPAPAPAAAPAAAPAPGGPYLGAKLERPLPEQGFRGPRVEHDSGRTATADWQAEFGPAAGHRSFVEICADYPENEWCRLHMYDSRSQRWRSGAEGRGGGRCLLLAAVHLAALVAGGRL